MSEGSNSDPRPAGGIQAVLNTARHTLREAGALRGARSLRRLNQKEGFDCPGCAWPDPKDDSALEFCENGAKHVAHEATKRRVTPEFFADWPVSKLLKQEDQWLEAQGRLTQPMLKPADADRYEAISWDAALDHVAARLQQLASPDEAIFYTSGRTSNEAAFLYQLFVRQFGTNNLPDCSHLCHESSGVALSEVIGGGKGTVGLEDFERADAILLIGQNPGSNHPRMLTTLQAAKRRGCKIVSINPLKERGLVSFAHPKELAGLLGRGTPISDLFLQVRVGGDVALLKGIAKHVLLAEEDRPGRVLDASFIREFTQGFDSYAARLREESWQALEIQSGVSRTQMHAAAKVYIEAERVITCWAMGLTQHKNAVANVQEIANLMLLRGNIGVLGAGLCPVRGHSNVQGDRTMGICEKAKPDFLRALGNEFDFSPPAEHGYNAIEALRAMAERKAKIFFALGGNFVRAMPDTEFTEAALRRCQLTVQISTKLCRSHLVVGNEALILPCLGRTEEDRQGDNPQFVTVENSMAVVHRSQGRLKPASPDLRSEVSIVAGLANRVLSDRSTVRWEELTADYDRIRAHISRVIPGFEDFNERVRKPGGFTLPRAGRTRQFATASGKAHFTVQALSEDELEEGEYLLTTIRSHDQFNTTIYSQDDRDRGIRGSRLVVLLNPEDMADDGLEEGQAVDLCSRFSGRERRLSGFRTVAYDLPRRCAAAYYPEANALVPVGSFAEKSHTPTYKSIPIRISPSPHTN